METDRKTTVPAKTFKTVIVEDVKADIVFHKHPNQKGEQICYYKASLQDLLDKLKIALEKEDKEGLTGDEEMEHLASRCDLFSPLEDDPKWSKTCWNCKIYSECAVAHNSIKVMV